MPSWTIPFVGNVNSAVTNVKDLLGVQKNPYSIFGEYGTHHTCYYDLIVDIPQNVINMLHARQDTTISAQTLAERLNYFCSELYIPMTTLYTHDIRVGGEKIAIPYDKDYGDFQTTFYIDGGYTDDGGMTYNIFHAWQDLIYPPMIRTFNYPEDYQTTVSIALYTTPDAQPLFGKENIVIIKLAEAWPYSIQNVPLSGRSSDASYFTIMWKYRYFTSGTTKDDQTTLGAVTDLIKNGFRVARSISGIWNDAKNTYTSLQKAWDSITNIF